MLVRNKVVLHIANDYAGSTVYKNLVLELDNLNVGQVVYTALREKNKVGVNQVELKSNSSRIIYSPILNWHIDRIFYPYKILKILKDIQSKVDFTQVKYIHGHTWYSDGGVAYFLSKKYDIPFIVTIRNTDLNFFQKKIAYLRPFGRKILIDAKQIILISASYKQRVLQQSSLHQVVSQIEEKIKIIPNGVDPYWIKNLFIKPSRRKDGVFNILYIGRFTASKQVLLLQDSIIQLSSDLSYKIIFHLVGSGGEDEMRVLELVKEYPHIFTFHGQINDKDKLLTIFRNCDIFAMTSRHETFGLVYIEAMLQGLPILYTEGEGIDGFYNEKIGEKISMHTVEEATHKLKTMIVNFDQYRIPLEKIKENHDWMLIAKKYQKIYQSST